MGTRETTETVETVETASRGNASEGRLRRSVLIVDDHALTRRGVAMTIEADPRYVVMESVASVEDALQSVSRTRFDVVVIDLHMPGRTGLDLLSELVGRLDLTTIVLTGTTQGSDLQAAVDLGARGVLSKEDDPAVLLDALDAVVSGKTYLSRSVNGVLRAQPDRVVPLSPRQVAILHFLATGVSNKEIAFRLDISAPTVSFHLAELRKKLAVSHNRQIVDAARKAGHLR